MPTTGPDKSAGQSTLRRMPSQRRSREKVERILEAAATLIAEHGSDALKMSEVARLAALPIGSLYQYFPDKSAIVRTLAERSTAEGRACIEAALSGVADMEALCRAFAGLVDTYYGLFLAEPVMRDIWCGTQADKTLRQIELEDSRANGAVLAAVLSRLCPGADPEQVAASAFLVMQLGEATMRLAVSVHRTEGDRLVETYKRMALTELRRHAATSG